MRERYVLDASVLGAVMNLDDPAHHECYWYFRSHFDAGTATWVVPGLIFFELQAMRSRRNRERIDIRPPFHSVPLYLENTQLYEITPTFLQRVEELDLYRTFDFLRGADLLYACIARVEDLPLVTRDGHFDRCRDVIQLIDPARSSVP